MYMQLRTHNVSLPGVRSVENVTLSYAKDIVQHGKWQQPDQLSAALPGVFTLLEHCIGPHPLPC